MKKQLKSYLVFTTSGVKIAAFIVEPVLLLAIGIYSSVWLGFPGYIWMGACLTFFEIMLDFMIFGGICAKDVSHLEYLKGSKNGDKIMRSALSGQLVRCFGMDLLLLIVNYVIFQLVNQQPIFEKQSVLLVLLLLVSSYFMITLGNLIGRFFDSIQISYIIASIVTSLETALLVVGVKHFVICIIGIAILAVVVSVLNVEIACRHIKESYYDKTVENGI